MLCWLEASYGRMFFGRGVRPIHVRSRARWRRVPRHRFPVHSNSSTRRPARSACTSRPKAAAARALLLYPTSLDFVHAIWGCFYAGTVAVPVAWRNHARGIENLLYIARDADANFALTTPAILAQLRPRLENSPDARRLRWVAMDSLGDGLADSWQAPRIARGDLALLQYTSGSTTGPRGVLTHENLMANQRHLAASFRQSEDSVIVTWLPLFHDMGLIGNLLHATYLEAQVVLMPPQQFLQSPVGWLRAITQYRGTASGGPNITYDFCASRISEADKADLDLSSWGAFNGSEPVSRETMERFAASSAQCGFRSRAFHPCYGLAEASPPVRAARYGDPADLAAGDGRSHIALGSGPAELAIVNPETRRRCAREEAGEIWVSDASVGQGYWRRPEESAQNFRARLADGSPQQYLRTGDIGILRNGELFVTAGRKNVIVLRGPNYQAEGIETAAGLRPQHVRAATAEQGRG